MKTKGRILTLNGVSIGIAILIIGLASCQKDNDILSATDTQNVNAESASAAYVNENSNISSNAIGGITSTQYTGGREEGTPLTLIGLGLRDDRLACATVTINRTGTKDAPSGTITIDFGTGCTDPRKVTRSGKMLINYSGKRWMPNSYISLHLVNFHRNDAAIEGIDSLVTQISNDSLHLQFQSTLTGGKITFGDGKSITREHNLTREWIRSAVSPLYDEWITLAYLATVGGSNGTASGLTKSGKAYTMKITKELVEKMTCLAQKVFIPVSGVKTITVGSEYTVDYGDGTCDNNVTVTVNGKAKVIDVTAEGN